MMGRRGRAIIVALAVVFAPLSAAADSQSRLCRGLGPDACAERITAMAEGSEPASATAALREAAAIFNGYGKSALVLAPSAPPLPDSRSSAAMTAVTAIPTRAPTSADPLNVALRGRRARISAAAFGWYSRSGALDESIARAALDGLLAANDCRRTSCPSMARILSATDRLPSNLAYEAGVVVGLAAPAEYVAFRRRQFAAWSAWIIAALAAGVIFAVRKRMPRLLGTLVVVIGALLVGGAVQFLGAGLLGASGWVAPSLWPATLTGNLALALIIAAPIAMISDQWPVRAALALVSAEIAWWAIPIIVAGLGMTLRMPHYSAGEDFTPLIGFVAGAMFAPLLAWALASVSSQVRARVASG
jgi:hypothetical protein